LYVFDICLQINLAGFMRLYIPEAMVLKSLIRPLDNSLKFK
jgi:hypothetical protein